MALPSVLAFLLLLWPSCLAFEVTEVDDEVAARNDAELVLNCTGDEPWDYCRWSFYSRACARSIEDVTDPACDIDPDRVKWRGVPSIDNKCTIAVSDLTLADSGVWTCQLIKGQDTVEVARKNYKVSIYAKGAVSFASKPHQQMMVGQTYVVECAGLGGVPAPDLRASVGPRLVAAEGAETLEEEMGVEEQQLEAIEDGGDGLLGGTVTRLFKYTPSANYVNMFVKCLGVQQDKHGETIYDEAAAKLPFDVVFKPLSLDRDGDGDGYDEYGEDDSSSPDVPQFFIEEGRSTEVVMRFAANPAPRDDQVVWHIVGENSNYSLMLPAGSARDRFEAPHIQVDGSQITATLLIHQASYEDMMNHCYLEAMNELGREEFEFTLKPMPMESEEDDGDEVETSGMSVGAIVGLVIGLLLLFVGVIILIVFLKKTQKCCFAPSKSKKFPGGDDYMTVAQNDNTAARAISTTSAPPAVATIVEENEAANSAAIARPENGDAAAGDDSTYVSRDEVDDEVGPMLRRGNTDGPGPDSSAVGAKGAKRAESYQIATGRSMTADDDAGAEGL